MDYIIIVSCWLGTLLAILAASAHSLGRAQGRIARLEARLDHAETAASAQLEAIAAHCRGLDRRIREAKALGREAAAAAGTALVEARAETASLRERTDARISGLVDRLDALEDEAGIPEEEDE